MEAKLRPRNSILGDIIHSRPYYVNDATNPRVYVGANDGMLHAFDAVTGREVFAYIPSMLIPDSSTFRPFPTSISIMSTVKLTSEK